MCGICGIVDYNRNNNLEEGLLQKMCAELRHRGPDDEGVYIDKRGPSVGLGHRRLKIIDLTEASHQPMCNEDRTIWIVFNGEIYNFQELRKVLESYGHKFKSHSDTEVIIHLYEEYGIDCIKRLYGMFALAIWDNNKQSLLLARDRFGKKPLLYSYNNGIFSFASEFMSLLASNNISKDINLNAIPDYITFGYIPAPKTIYNQIQKLLPGHFLILKDRELKIQRYWQLEYTKKNNIPLQEAIRKTGDLLQDAVKIRLYSDVPLGVFLSGGIDSSTVVGMMAKCYHGRIKTFSIGFDEKDFDELKYARIVAKHFDTDHHEFIVKPNALEILPRLIERYGEPYADSSCIPTYYVANQTRQYITVALNGDGGDELFAGYERYRAVYFSRLYNRIPTVLRKGIIEPILINIPSNIDRRNNVNRLKRFLKSIDLPLPQRYLRWIAIFDKELQNNLYSTVFLNKISELHQEELLIPYFADSQEYELIDILLRIDTNTYLPNDLLVKMDIATMANSLEARSPFLDHRLAKFVVSLKADFKMRWLVKKYLLKNIIKDFVPRANIHRPKMGFGVPIGKWFRGELKSLLTETLLSQKSLNREYFNADFIKGIVKQHLEQKIDYSQQLWSLLMLELWHRRFVD